ncbi:MAG: hypothetical protein M3336_00470 [Chloroflexota bacterium]|nr:hypothetical protein [Chloroflexota bacterium]
MRRAVLAAAVLVGSMLAAPSACADATPVQLLLLYVADVSNTGTPAASGIAELVMPEGEVRLAATGLPRLEAASAYVLWLVNTATDEHLRLGAFNASEDGAARFEDVLPDPIPDKQWTVMLVTVENTPTPSRPSAKRSIAGVFPPHEREPAPALLPSTGGAGPAESTARARGSWQADGEAALMASLDRLATGANRPDWLPQLGLAALTLGLGAIAGYGLGLKRR